MIRINIIKSVSQGTLENMCWSGVTEYRNEEQESFKDRKKYLTGRKYLCSFLYEERNHLPILFLKLNI